MKNTLRLEEWPTTPDRDKAFYMAVIDGSDRLTFVNTPLFQAFQRANAPFANKAFLDMIHRQDVDRVSQSFSDCRLHGDNIVVEARIKNGHYKWVKWKISPLMEGGSQENKLLCLGQDIAGEEQQLKYSSMAGRNYQSIMEGLNIGWLVRDKDGAMVAANQRAAEILGTTLEILYNETSLLPSSPSSPFMMALSTGQTQSNHVVHWPGADGAEKWILWNSQPLFENDQSAPYAVVSTLHDITQEKSLEKEVQAREALFSSFMDHTPYVSWIIDEDSNLVYANSALLKYFHGWKEVIGKNMSLFIPQPLFLALREKHDLALREQRAVHGIIKSMMADGKEHVFRVSVFPIHGASRPLSGGEALDITESYTARQEIEKANDRLYYISKATSEAIWDWDIRTGQIFCNPALRSLVGFDLDKVFNLDWCYRRIHEEDRVRVEQTMKAVMNDKGKSWEAEYRWLTNDGGYMTLHNRGFIVYEEGEAVRMIGSLQDMSEIRKLETQLVKQKLKQQKTTAEAIIHAQQEERARLGHELHDNVNQILASAQLFIGQLDPENTEFAGIKARSIEIVGLAIEELRQLAREMVMPDFKEEGLLGSIRKMVEELKFCKCFDIRFLHNNKKGIESLDPNLKISLFRIVQEQIKNIIKYSKAKNVVIDLHCDADQLRMEIADDGRGFDPQTTRRGLGLSNIYERTNLYNGKVILEAAPGEGCTLIVNIPREPSHS